MNSTQKLQQLLKELQRLTGLPLDIQVSEDEDPEKYIKQLQSLCSAYKNTTNKEHIIRRWLQGDIDEQDFFSFLEREHIEKNEKRVLYIIEFKNDIYPEIKTLLKNIISDSKSWIISYEKKSLILVWRFPKKKTSTIKEKAYELLNLLNAELMEQAVIAYADITESIEELPAAFQKACLTMKIGSVFYPDRTIYGHNELDVGPLLYDLSKETCREYIKDNLGQNFLENDSLVFRSDILETANCFLKNNLNIAETARQLHIHRNTLLYRLEQIQNETGLDIRHFDYAMTYKLSSMILLYLKNMTKETT